MPYYNTTEPNDYYIIYSLVWYNPKQLKKHTKTTTTNSIQLSTHNTTNVRTKRRKVQKGEKREKKKNGRKLHSFFSYKYEHICMNIYTLIIASIGRTTDDCIYFYSTISIYIYNPFRNFYINVFPVSVSSLYQRKLILTETNQPTNKTNQTNKRANETEQNKKGCFKSRMTRCDDQDCLHSFTVLD